MLRKKMTAAVLSLVLLALPVACGKKDEGAGSPSPSAAAQKPLTELTVLLDWYPNAVHTFLYAAEEQGYFKEAGLKVNFKVPAGTDDAMKLVPAGQADLAISYQTQTAIARSQGVPVVSVAAIVRHPLNQLFVRADSGIQSPKDLAGKQVGYPSMPIDEAAVKQMVSKDGGDVSKVKFVDIGYDLIPAITTKRVDAIIGGYINHEKLLIEKEGIKLLAFDPAKYGVPDRYELILIAAEDGYNKKKDAIQAFWQAARKGQEYTATHKEEALKKLLEKQNQEFPLDPEVEKQSLDILLPLMSDGNVKFGAQTEQSWKSVIDWLKEQGEIKGDVKAADAFRNID